MTSVPPPAVLADGQLVPIHFNGQDWLNSWHPPSDRPFGKNHGCTALCVTNDGSFVVVSIDGATFDLPGGRPEPGETLRQTLDREVLEEACARVEAATLLGFARGECTRGHECGLVLIRAQWHASVTLLPWDPRYEITHRRLIESEAELVRTIPIHYRPISRRLLHETQSASLAPW